MTDSQPTPNSAASNAPWQSPWAYGSALLRHPRLVVVFPLAVGFVAALWSVTRPREYVASAGFVPQDPAAIQSSLGAIASQFGFASPSASTSSPLFYADLLQSREVMASVLNSSYRTTGSPAFAGNLLRYFKIAPDTGERSVGDGLRELHRVTGVRTDRTTGVVRFSVTLENPILAAQVTRRYLELVNEYNLQRRQSQARAEREFVQSRLDVARAELREAEESVSAFYRRNRRFSDSPELVAEEQRLQRLVGQRQAFYSTLAQSFETAKIEEVRNTPVITLIERPEGFVEPKPRGTVRKAFVGTFVGFFLVAAWILVRDYLNAVARRGSADFREFSSLLASLRARLRRGSRAT